MLHNLIMPLNPTYNLVKPPPWNTEKSLLCHLERSERSGGLLPLDASLRMTARLVHRSSATCELPLFLVQEQRTHCFIGK